MTTDTPTKPATPEPTLVPELSVTNLDRSLAFYLGKLGFRLRYGRPEEGFAYLEREGADLMLDQLNIGRSWITGEMERPFGRGMNLQLNVSNVEVLRQNFETVFLELETIWYRGDGFEYGCRQFIAQDPDGYLIRLQQSVGERPL